MISGFGVRMIFFMYEVNLLKNVFRDIGCRLE